jgi:tetratricopeptide (TPR) repeat protein
MHLVHASSGSGILRRFVGTILLVATAAGLHGQVPGPPPQDVQAILQQLQAGKPLSPKDQQRLQAWAKGQAGVPKGQGAGAPGIKPEQLTRIASPVPMPDNPPSEQDFTALLKRLAAGAKVDAETRSRLDRVDSDALGAVLDVGGLAAESVYAAASALQRHPEALVAANNLGVSLSEAGEHQASALVLLHVRARRPGSPLAAVNLGWTYFHAGALAQAEREFKRALGLAPDMAAPETGLGLIAFCRGRQAEAAQLLKRALGKGYSHAGAVVFAQVRAAASGGEGEQSTSSSNGSGDASSGPIPDLPVKPEPERNGGQAESLARIRDWAQGRVPELMQRYQELAVRVAELNRRGASGDGSALYLPRVFERERFEFDQVVELAFSARFRNMEPTIQQITQVMNTNASQTGAILLPEMEAFLRMQQEQIALMEEMIACGNDEICKAKVEARLRALEQRMKQKSYEICMHSRQSMDVTYAQAYKHWRTMWDDYRPAAADLYAFTEPILQRVWVPSLNELMQVQRELTVMAMYHPLAGEAAALAELAKAYKDLECVPPPPPQPPEEAREPELSRSRPPRCPLDPPISAGCGIVSITLGCDSAAIEGGEGLRFKASRDFRKHETTLWVGAGASAEAKADFLGPFSPKAELTAEVGVGVTLGQNGTVSDVFVSSRLGASAGLGSHTVDASAAGSIALEGGATLSGSLPGDLGGTLHD